MEMQAVILLLATCATHEHPLVLSGEHGAIQTGEPEWELTSSARGVLPLPLVLRWDHALKFPNQCLTEGVLAISPKGQWSVARRFSPSRALRYACNLLYLVTLTLKNTS